MADFPQILGVYSQNKHTGIGTGATSSDHITVTFWYVRQMSENSFEIQPLTNELTPSGVKSNHTKKEFLANYTPEPNFYQDHDVPPLISAAKKVQDANDEFDADDLSNEEREIFKNLGIGDIIGEDLHCFNEDVEKLKAIFNTLFTSSAKAKVRQKRQFNDFAIALRKDGYLDESLAYYNKILEVSDEDEHLLFNLARVHFDKGDEEQCLRHLEMALHVNPEFDLARKFLIWLESQRY